MLSVRYRQPNVTAPLKPVDRARYSQFSMVQHVRVSHCGLDVGVAEQFLYGPDVVAVFQQMRRERVLQRKGSGALRQVSFSDRPRDRTLAELGLKRASVLSQTYPAFGRPRTQVTAVWTSALA